MYVLIGILCVLFALIYIFTKKKYSYWIEKGVLQCKPIFLIGNLTNFIHKKYSYADNINNIYNKYPDSRCVGLYLFLQPTLMIRDLDLIKQITVKDFDHFTDHRIFTEEEDSSSNWGSNIFSLKGERWKEMRATLGPVFTCSRMRILFELVDDCAKNFTNYFVNKTKNTITVELHDVFSRVISDVVAITVFGVSSDSLKEPNNEFFRMGQKASDSIAGLSPIIVGILPSLSKFFTTFPTEVSAFLKDLVMSCLELREKNKIIRPDLIQILLEAKKGLLKNDEDGDKDLIHKQDYYQKFKKKHQITNDDIVSQCFIFFFAGVETTTTLLMFTCYELALHPDIQNRLRKEIIDVLKENDGIVTYDGIMKMKYLEMVLLEGLRKYPLVTVIDRNCVKPYTIVPKDSSEKPIHLEKNDVVWIPIYALHRDPKHYPDPEKFDPERFNTQNRKLMNTYSFLPFGVGPRICIGARFALLQSKVMLANLLTKFELIVTDKTAIPLEYSKTYINLHVDKGVYVGFRSINK